MHPGKKLALARRYTAPALTQNQLAEKLNVKRATLARWESSGQIPTKDLFRVAVALGLDPTWLTNGEETPPQTLAHEPSNLRPTNRPEQMGKAGQSLQRGDQVMLAVWRGVMASEGECEFWPSETPEFRAIPSFLASNDPDAHVLCIATGVSMAPRLDHAERAVIHLDPDPPIGSLVVARRPDGANFIKVLRKSKDRLELHSLNPNFPPITNLKDWTLKGYVTAILHTYTGNSANIEYDDGRPLRA